MTRPTDPRDMIGKAVYFNEPAQLALPMAE